LVQQASLAEAKAQNKALTDDFHATKLEKEREITNLIEICDAQRIQFQEISSYNEPSLEKAELRELLKQKEESYAEEQAEQIASYASSLSELLETMQENAVDSKIAQDRLAEQARVDLSSEKKRSATDRLFVSIRMSLGRLLRGRVWTAFNAIRARYAETRKAVELGTVEGQMNALRRTIVDMEAELNSSADALRRAEEGLRRVGERPMG